jgi:putative membrane protein
MALQATKLPVSKIFLAKLSAIMPNSDFSIPRRQSSKGVVLYFVMAAQKLIRGSWPIILIYVFKNDSLTPDKKVYVFIGVAVVLLLMLVHAFFTYFRFYFFIEDGEFKVTKGYLKKVSLSIPLDRIQTINSRQNVFQQWLKVVSVEIDTAGAATKELKIVALKKETADALTDILNENKAEIAQEETGEEHREETAQEKKTILQLGFFDLFKICLSENHIKNVLIIFGFMWGIVDRVKDYFTGSFEEASEQAKTFLLTSNALVYSILIISFLIIGLTFSILMVLLRYYDLNFSREDRKFYLQSGLLNKKSITIPFSKIQVISWRTNPIRNLMDFVTLNLVQASSSEENRKQAIDIPGCNSEHLVRVQSEIFPGYENETWSQHHSHYNFSLRIWFFIGLLPSTLAIVIGWMNWPVMSIAAAWFFISMGISFLAYKKHYFRISENLIENSTGSIGQNFSRMFNFKVQTVKYRQTIFQRRKNLATLNIYTAGGKVLSMPYINSDLAFELSNYLLYKVESNNKKWM